jgi:hypothetical protein
MRCVLALAVLSVFSSCSAAPKSPQNAHGAATRPFGFTSFGRSTFADTNGDGLPDTRLDDVTSGITSNTRADARPPKEPPPPAAATDRMLVQRGELVVEVARPEESIARCLARVTELGGYLAQQVDGMVQVRVPAPKFDALFAELRGFGRVLSQSRSAQDVTEEYVDLGIRLDNARKSRERLLALLQKADRVEDILKIEEQLRRLTEEIERMEGRAKFLADQVAMASLSAKFVAAREAQSERQPTASRFEWINAVGAERVREDF